MQWMILSDADVQALRVVDGADDGARLGLMSYFQPRLEPTHAALIYLMEPVIAAGFAMFVAHDDQLRSHGRSAGLILAANFIVEP